jgi:hypothetical protein
MHGERHINRFLNPLLLLPLLVDSFPRHAEGMSHLTPATRWQRILPRTFWPSSRKRKKKNGAILETPAVT